MLDDLLDAAKAGRGHLDIQPEIIDLRAPAGQAVENLSRRFIAKDETLHVLLPDRAVMVKG